MDREERKVGRRMGRDEVGTLHGSICPPDHGYHRTPKEIDRYGRDYMRCVASEQGYQRYLVWRAQNEAVIDADVELAESGAAVA